ncbi:MAG TPA: hypothetical protein VFX49_01720, partial [Chloroflexota bacterium]|nr:hypothetical protein [Chloroflexota bacterium]
MSATDLTAAEQRELVEALARAQVSEIAPNELPLFRTTSAAYFKRPGEPQRRQVGDGDMLGFGVGGAVTFLTPVILAVTSEVVGFLAAELTKQLKAQGTEAVTAAIKRLFKPLQGMVGGEAKKATGAAAPAAAAATAAPPALSQSQLARIRQLAFEKAKQFSLPDDKA